MSPVSPWPVPDPLPGEDRTYGGGLYVDLVPAPTFGINCRKVFTSYQWSRLSRGIKARADFTCEFCTMPESPEQNMYHVTHERFSYDGASSLQRLTRFICSCRRCDEFTHFGRALVYGGSPELILWHALAVKNIRTNTITLEDVKAEAWAALELWKRRSAMKWTVDLSILAGTGLPVNQESLVIAPVVES
ncbi:hypothetical protein QYM41_16435 [Kocuria sp. CPCC 205268]|uniref:hypothetical protein n=1 Tax=Kocuria oxytropis TaxID=3058913 RepID=UPI0034D3FB4C